MSRKTVLSFLIFVLLSAFAGYFFASRTTQLNESESDILITDEGAGTASFPTVSLDKLPRGKTMVISGVEVKNFVNDGKILNQYGDIEISNTANYQITYHLPENKFLISVAGSPFFSNASLAENELLRILEIDEESACRLDVSITTPRFANPDEAGGVYGLSFCQGG
jgi:hypothetical protein